MRRKAFSIATLFVAAAISVAVVSCQKDNETENENQVVTKSANDESRELLNRIYAFQELRDYVRSGAKSGESMTLEQLRDDIDLTFNYEHSQHATPFANASLDTFYVRMPQVDANGNVSATEAIATYNAFETELAELMAGVDDDSNLAKNFSIKFPETGAKSGDAIEVVFTRGAEGEKYPWFAPFEEGDDYIWGLDLGRCDHGLSEVTDAADELTERIHQNSPASTYKPLGSPYRIEYVKFTPYQDLIHLADYIYVEQDNYPYDHIFWLFHVSGEFEEEPCIKYYELNQEYNNFWVTHINPNGIYHYHPQNNSPYYDCVIVDEHLYNPEGNEVIDPSKRSKRVHTAYVLYAYTMVDNSNS